MSVLSASAQSMQEWKDSLSVLSQKIELNPQSIDLRMRKAEANIMLEQWQYALDEYTIILNSSPGHIGALYFRGFVNAKLRRYGLARQDYEKVLMFEPDHCGALSGMVLASLQDGLLQRAFDDANRLVEMHEKEASVYAIRSQVEDAMGMHEFALTDIEQAMDLESGKVRLENRKITPDDDLVIYASQALDLMHRMGEKRSGINKVVSLLCDLGLPRSAALSLVKK